MRIRKEMVMYKGTHRLFSEKCCESVVCSIQTPFQVDFWAEPPIGDKDFFLRLKNPNFAQPSTISTKFVAI